MVGVKGIVLIFKGVNFLFFGSYGAFRVCFRIGFLVLVFRRFVVFRVFSLVV